MPDLTVEDLARRSRELRRELADEGARVDALAGDTAHGMRRAHQEGLHLISLPKRYGGLSNGTINFAAEALIEIGTNLSASDGSLGQNWLVEQSVIREIYHSHEHVPDATLAELASQITNKGVRFMASNSEAGSPQPVASRKVDGGIVVNGVKTFNSNSGGGGYASVGHRIEGSQGRHIALIPLDAAGVRQHHDWDNMGQRGTYSQSITFENVFVPDGWHHPAPLESEFVPLPVLMHGAIMLGSAMGGLDAAINHLRATNRVMMRPFEKASDDPLVMRRIGAYSAKLESALGYQRQVSRNYENIGSSREELTAVMIDSFRHKSVCTEVALEVSGGIFDLTGGRTTANKYRFDRFWRNVRTFSVHDPVEVMQVWIGQWSFERKPPSLVAPFWI